MKGNIEAYLLPHWSYTPVNTDVGLGLTPDRSFLNDGLMVTKGAVIRVRCRAVPYSGQPGVRGVALKIPEYELLTTDDSTEPAARYSAFFFNWQNPEEVYAKWDMFQKFSFPVAVLTPDERDGRRGSTTWGRIYVANLPEERRKALEASAPPAAVEEDGDVSE